MLLKGLLLFCFTFFLVYILSRRRSNTSVNERKLVYKQAQMKPLIHQMHVKIFHLLGKNLDNFNRERMNDREGTLERNTEENEERLN